jgi:hypothetical protein
MATWPVLSEVYEDVFAQQNLLQAFKLDSDGQIPMIGVQQWKKGADVASAAALMLGNDGNYFDVTGTVGITSIVQLAVGGAAVQPGTIIKLHFDDVVLITHHPTNLVLPRGANITTAPGDEFEFMKYESGWRCASFNASSLSRAYFCTTPEEYGAHGDGSTDDWAAFNAMFEDLKLVKASVRKKIILNPASFYLIGSRKNATNVFEFSGIQSLQMEGPGMLIPTIVYDGADFVTNFFNFDGAGSPRISEMRIEGNHVSKAASKITNIFYLNNIIGTFERLNLVNALGAGITGFNWMTEVRHCVLEGLDLGLDAITTTVHVTGVYANGCRIGFSIFCSYGSYVGCACDGADVAYALGEPWSLAMTGCGAESCRQAIAGLNGPGRALSLSINGFTVDQTNLIGDPTLPESCVQLTESAGVILGFFGKVANQYWYDFGGNSPNLVICPPIYGYTINKSLIKDYATAGILRCMNVPILLGREYQCKPDPNDPVVIALANLRTTIEINLTRYNSCELVSFGLEAGTVEYLTTVNWLLAQGPGPVVISGSGTLGTIIEFNPSTPDIWTGIGMRLWDIEFPVIFKNIHFKFERTQGWTTMFEINRCPLIRFEGCKFEKITGGSASGGFVFNIDAYSRVEIDKATMDNMVTAYWSGLDGSGRDDAIKFVGYSAKPIAGLFDTGHRVYFTNPAAAGYLGAVCTAGGAPGTWKGFGLIEA